MHEMSICESVIQSLESIAAREGAKKVTQVSLEIGCFAGVENEALRFCFDAVTKNTIAEGARLDIIDENGTANCFECGNVFEITSRLAECPKCNSVRLMVSGGDALRIKTLEIE